MELFEYLHTHHAICLNEQQQASVLATQQNTLLLAVPGSGKTTVMVTRIAYLLEDCHAAPQQILSLTFSRESAHDMAARFAALFGERTAAQPRFSTLHSFSYSVLLYYCKQYRRQLLTLLDGSSLQKSSLFIVRTLIRARNEDYVGDDTLEDTLNAISYAKNRCYTTQQIQKMEVGIENFADIFEAYEAFKKEHALMDYDDMLALCLRILEQFPQIAAHYQKQYRYINVDEAQDTSYLQHRIIQKLAQGNIVFMVGDEDQTIYSFRGAYPQALLSFAQNYPDALLLKLEQNFRSSADIVKAANEFIKLNEERYPKEMFCANTAQNSIEVISLEDYKEQSAQICTYLQQKPADQTAAILYRNNDSAVLLMKLLLENRIDFYVKEHKLTFFKSFLVSDIVAYLNLAIDEKDIKAFEKIYYKLGYSKYIYRLVEQQYQRYSSILECVRALDLGKDWQAAKTKEQIRGFSFLKNRTASQALSIIELELGYGRFMDKRVEFGFSAESMMQKWNVLKVLAQDCTTIYDFLDCLEKLQTDLTAALGNRSPHNTVTLSTIHSAKGLEFDSVLLLDMIDNIIPTTKAIDEQTKHHPAEMENETRLFYVAVTRAKSKLILFQSKKLAGITAYPSRFVRTFLLCDSAADGYSRIHHKAYGYGVIIGQQKEVATVSFQKSGIKTINLSYCLEQGIVKIIKED